MELTRVFLLSALCFVAVMLWNAWENEHPKTTAITQQMTNPISVGKKQTAAIPPTGVQQLVIAQQPTKTVNSASQKLVTVHTDVLELVIDTVGGNIVKAKLLAYPQKLNQQAPVELLSDDSAKLYVAQSGLMGTNGPDTQEGQATYNAVKSSYNLEQGQDQLTVDLTWKNAQGLEIQKQFTLHRNSYLINVNYKVNNQSKQIWKGQLYNQLQRKKIPIEHSLFTISPYMGGAISTPEKAFEKISFDKMAETNLNMPVQGGWAAMVEHYFLSAWIPNKNNLSSYYSHVNNDIYTLGILGPTVNVEPGKQIDIGAKLYVGPEIMEQLKSAAPNLDLTIDYGILWFISIAIFWLMKQIHNIVGNWGWSIVLVTVAIKLVFYHLSAKSYHSMAAMRKLQPRLQLLKERYGDDRQKLTQETMDLYRTEKINPLGGCLPILVQIPVFIALYWVLLESIELRQAPFILWIHDLSAKDPYYILPVLMGLTMLIQQRLNPPPPDPVQAKMMQFLPVFFIFLFLNFPAGLVLYWFVNNTLSILQQWYIMRKADIAVAKKKVK